MTYKCFEKKISGGGITNENMWDQPSVEELHKRIIRKFKNRKVHSTFIVDIWAADLADVQLISECHHNLLFSMSPHPSTNFEIQKYYQNEPRSNGVYSRNNLPKIKDGVYVKNSAIIRVWINRNSLDSFVCEW